METGQINDDTNSITIPKSQSISAHSLSPDILHSVDCEDYSTSKDFHNSDLDSAEIDEMSHSNRLERKESIKTSDYVDKTSPLLIETYSCCDEKFESVIEFAYSVNSELYSVVPTECFEMFNVSENQCDCATVDGVPTKSSVQGCTFQLYVPDELNTKLNRQCMNGNFTSGVILPNIPKIRQISAQINETNMDSKKLCEIRIRQRKQLRLPIFEKEVKLSNPITLLSTKANTFEQLFDLENLSSLIDQKRFENCFACLVEQAIKSFILFNKLPLVKDPIRYETQYTEDILICAILLLTKFFKTIVHKNKSLLSKKIINLLEANTIFIDEAIWSDTDTFNWIEKSPKSVGLAQNRTNIAILPSHKSELKEIQHMATLKDIMIAEEEVIKLHDTVSNRCERAVIPYEMDTITVSIPVLRHSELKENLEIDKPVKIMISADQIMHDLDRRSNNYDTLDIEVEIIAPKDSRKTEKLCQNIIKLNETVFSQPRFVNSQVEVEQFKSIIQFENSQISFPEAEPYDEKFIEIYLNCLENFKLPFKSFEVCTNILISNEALFVNLSTKKLIFNLSIDENNASYLQTWNFNFMNCLQNKFIEAIELKFHYNFPSPDNLIQEFCDQVLANLKVYSIKKSNIKRIKLDLPVVPGRNESLQEFTSALDKMPLLKELDISFRSSYGENSSILKTDIFDMLNVAIICAPRLERVNIMMPAPNDWVFYSNFLHFLNTLCIAPTLKFVTIELTSEISERAFEVMISQVNAWKYVKINGCLDSVENEELQVNLIIHVENCLKVKSSDCAQLFADCHTPIPFKVDIR